MKNIFSIIIFILLVFIIGPVSAVDEGNISLENIENENISLDDDLNHLRS